MKNNILSKTFTLLAVCLVAISCGGEGGETPDNKPQITPVYDAYVLCEGVWGGNDAKLCRLATNTGDISPDFFAEVNGRGLGDQAQDAVVYGSKLYVSVTESKTLLVADAATSKAIKQIMLSGKPRSIACKDGKVYVDNYDKTIVRLDTATLQLDGICPLDRMLPEQMAIVGNNLYVTSTYSLLPNGSFVYDSVLQVVDLTTFTKTDNIVVGLNPGRVKALNGNRLVVCCTGDYGATASSAVVVNLDDNSVTKLPVALGNIDIAAGNIYGYTITYDAGLNQTRSEFFRIDGATLQVTPMLKAYESVLTNAYGINLDGDGNLYVCNSVFGSNSDVFCFGPDGTKKWKSEAAHFASKVIFW
ncbi:MAG: hypothetical protein SPJ13_02775 [Bacteroidales bacterium]|nr:hypothetical protein [Bacteroidales bacterium]